MDAELQATINDMQAKLDRIADEQWQEKLDEIAALTIENARLKAEVKRLNRIIESLESR